MRLTVPEAARRVGRNPETIRRWIWSGRLVAEKVGNQHIVEAEALDALSGAAERNDGPVPEVAGSWSEWLRRATTLRDRLSADRRRLPAASDLLRESRRQR